jgi:CBS domain containing-hemolysin-like protein
MLFKCVIILFIKVFTITYKWLHDNLVVYLVNFAKGFELVIIIIAVVSFLLFNLFLTMIHLRKLPKYYAIEIVDAYGNETAVEGLRLIFTTYDAAESYAWFYQDIYKDQYKFRVTGLKE